MNTSRLAVLVLSIVLCAAAIWAFSSQPSHAQQGGLPARKRCVGIATAILRSENPVVTRVYRAYDDGTVEIYDDGAPGAKWTPMGQ